MHGIRFLRPLNMLSVITVFLLLMVLPGPATQPVIAADCSAIETEWSEVIERLRQELAEFKKVEDTHVEKIIGRPLVNIKASATIAEQVAEGLKVKEGILSEKRKICRKLLNREEQLFSALENCVNSRDFRRAKRDRRKLLKNVVFTIAEVREVEGQSQYSQYAGPWWNPYAQQQYQQQYNGGAYSYWPNQQQQMQRRGWWGR